MYPPVGGNCGKRKRVKDNTSRRRSRTNLLFLARPHIGIIFILSSTTTSTHNIFHFAFTCPLYEWHSLYNSSNFNIFSSPHSAFLSSLTTVLDGTTYKKTSHLFLNCAYSCNRTYSDIKNTRRPCSADDPRDCRDCHRSLQNNRIPGCRSAVAPNPSMWRRPSPHRTCC